MEPSLNFSVIIPLLNNEIKSLGASCHAGCYARLINTWYLAFKVLAAAVSPSPLWYSLFIV